MKNKFTLIELIVVIAVLGVLAAIVIPNISNMKERSLRTAVVADTRVLQTATDMYQIDNNSSLPTIAKPTKELPQPVDFTKIYPEQIRNLPKVEGVKYWVDVNGTVWSSFEDMPQGFKYNASTGDLSWNKVDTAIGYEIQEVVKSDSTSDLQRAVIKYKPIKRVMDVGAVTFKGEANKAYAISSVDKYGFASAPIGTGLGYELGYQDTLESIKKGQSGQTGNDPAPAIPDALKIENLSYSVVEGTNVVNVLGKTSPNSTITVKFPDGQTVTGTSNPDGAFSIPSTNAMDTEGKIQIEVTNSKGTKQTGELNFTAAPVANALYTWERTQEVSKASYRAVPIFTQTNPEFYPEKKTFSPVNQYYGIEEGTTEPFDFTGTDNVYVARSGDKFLVSKQNFDNENWNGMNLKTQTAVNSSAGLTSTYYPYYGSRTLTTVVTTEQADKIYPSYVDTANGYKSPFEKGQLYLMIAYNSGLEFNAKDHITFKKLELIEQVSEKQEFKEVVTSTNKDAYPKSGVGTDGYMYTAKKTVDSTKYFDNAGLPLDSLVKLNVMPKEIGTNTPVTLSYLTSYDALFSTKYEKWEVKLDGNLINGVNSSLIRYASLPAGEHVFEARLLNKKGVWSDWVSKKFVVQDKIVPLPEINITERDTSGVNQTGYYDNYYYTNKVAFNVKNGAAVRILKDNGTFVSEYSFGNDFGRNSSYSIAPNGDLVFWKSTETSGAYYKAIVLDDSGTITDSISFYLDGYSSSKPKQSSKIDIQATYGPNSVTVKASKPSSSVYPTTASVALNEVYIKADGTKGDLMGSSNNYYNSSTRNVDLTKVFTFSDLKPNTTYKLTVNSNYQDSTTASSNYQYIYFKTN